jgi:segregation and condensation protein A
VPGHPPLARARGLASPAMGYEVRTEVFEGPFDLLLRLITAQEVDVYEISLSRVVDGYLAELRRLESLDLEVATEFLLIAACLVELKCRRLLPGRADDDLEEEMALFEQRDLLLARLVECRTFTAAAQAIQRLESLASLSLPRRCGADERFADLRPDLLARVTPALLRDAALAALADKPRPRVETDHVLVDEVTVAEMVDALAARLPSLGPIAFRDLTAGLAQRIQVIVNFLAVLELYKQGLVDLVQTATFGQLMVRWVAPAGEVVEMVVPDAVPPSAALVEADYRG